MASGLRWSRRGLLAGATALSLAGCGRKTAKPDAAKPSAKAGPMTLAGAARGDWRSPADKAGAWDDLCLARATSTT